MNLSYLIAEETGIPIEGILLLKQTDERVKAAYLLGVSIDELNAIQPTNTPYDYHRPGKIAIEIIVVIVDKHLYGVYDVAGVEAQGTNYQIGSAAFHTLETSTSEQEKPCQRFRLVRRSSVWAGLPVQGWTARVCALRHHTNGFKKIMVDCTGLDVRDAIDGALQAGVRNSMAGSPEARAARLAAAPKKTSRVLVSTYMYSRNPDVVAEVLLRAKGFCGQCRRPAPFRRGTDGSAYLEVHHIQHLAKGGDDTVENAQALCPNCHRERHFGPSTIDIANSDAPDTN